MRLFAGLSLPPVLLLSSTVLSALAVSSPNVLNLENINGPITYEDLQTNSKPPVQAPIPHESPGPKLPTPRPLVIWHGLGRSCTYIKT
jgi:hypothetical protein